MRRRALQGGEAPASRPGELRREGYFSVSGEREMRLRIVTKKSHQAPGLVAFACLGEARTSARRVYQLRLETDRDQVNAGFDFAAHVDVGERRSREVRIFDEDVAVCKIEAHGFGVSHVKTRTQPKPVASECSCERFSGESTGDIRKHRRHER